MFLQVVSFLTTWRSPLHTHWPATSQRFHPSSSSSLPAFLFLWELSPSSALTWALTWSTCSTPFIQFFCRASRLTVAVLIIEDISFKLRGFSSLHHCCRFLDFTMLFLMSLPLLHSEYVLCLGPTVHGGPILCEEAHSPQLCVQTIHIICGLWTVADECLRSDNGGATWKSCFGLHLAGDRGSSEYLHEVVGLRPEFQTGQVHVLNPT